MPTMCKLCHKSPKWYKDKKLLICFQGDRGCFAKGKINQNNRQELPKSTEWWEIQRWKIAHTVEEKKLGTCNGGDSLHCVFKDQW